MNQKNTPITREQVKAIKVGEPFIHPFLSTKSEKESTSKRNMTPQYATMRDGSKKLIFVKKKFNAPQYLDRKAFWRQINETPRKATT